MPDFTEVLNKPAEEIEKPKPKPTGTYQAVVQGMPQQNTRTIQNEEVNILSFSLKAIAAYGEDVDQEALAAAADISTWPPFRREFWLNGEQGVYGLKQFLENTLDIDPKKKTLSQMCAEAPGKQLLMTLKHRPYQNKTTGEMEIATEIDKTAKL